MFAISVQEQEIFSTKHSVTAFWFINPESFVFKRLSKCFVSHQKSWVKIIIVSSIMQISNLKRHFSTQVYFQLNWNWLYSISSVYMYIAFEGSDKWPRHSDAKPGHLCQLSVSVSLRCYHCHLLCKRAFWSKQMNVQPNTTALNKMALSPTPVQCLTNVVDVGQTLNRRWNLRPMVV